MVADSKGILLSMKVMELYKKRFDALSIEVNEEIEDLIRDMLVNN